jgi:hypothetical protein
MKYSWAFKEAGPGDRARESQVEKFFNSDAVANRANAIVREGIQNSLDAAPNDAGVRVRITLGSWSADQTTKRLSAYTKGFHEHFDVEAVQAKIASPPAQGEPFRYLVFEDFGTSGLTGDPAQWWPDEYGQPNPFFNYFRAEGISDKTEGSRGRHGVGRLVFMFASRVRSIFGLTRRSYGGENEELLMGTSVLRNHWFQQKPYLPDGWFGVRDEEDSRLTLPVKCDEDFVSKFKADFRLSRKDENGLSVIVPWLSADVTVNEILKAVLAGYFYPILRGKLVVEVVSESDEVQTIDYSTIESIIEAQPPETAAHLRPVIALAKACLAVPDTTELKAPPGTGAPKWDPSNIVEQALQKIHEDFETGKVVALRVPMRIRTKGADPVACFFNVFIQRDPGISDGQILFVREGIIITDVRPRRISGIRALVVVDEGPLATFLGDAENPSHTQWQAELVRDKYTFHRASIEYVVQSVPSILSLISQQQKKPDTSLLLDLFSLPAEEGIKTKQKRQKNSEGIETEPEKLDIPKTLKRCVTEKRADGFVVRRGDAGTTRPLELSIKVAYGVRRGSPFAKYNPADFRLGLGGINCTLTGCDFIDHDENWMHVRIDQDDFEISVTGFDTSHRDLHVDVKIKGEGASPEQTQEQEVENAATI